VTVTETPTETPTEASTETPMNRPGEIAGWPKLVVTYTTDPVPPPRSWATRASGRGFR
jgi:hypothetical protein